MNGKCRSHYFLALDTMLNSSWHTLGSFLPATVMKVKPLSYMFYLIIWSQVIDTINIDLLMKKGVG